MHLVPVAHGMVHDVWPDVQGLIENAAKRSFGRMTADSIRQALADRAMQLWLAEDDEIQAVAVTELLTYATGLKVCDMVIVTGEGRNSWLALINGIRAWAEANGCVRIQAQARPGWAEVMKPLGWRETHRFIEVEI